MAGAMGKRKRYNWRARFALATDRDRQNRGTPEDTNVLELPSKARKNSEQKGIEPPRKKKKLSSRQKKHLKKVVEKKEKKAKRAEVLKQLAKNAIPGTEINLLHSSTTIGRAKQTKKQAEHRIELHKQAGMVDDLAGTSGSKRKWRQRNNSKLKTEKVLFAAKNDSSDEESCDDSKTVDVSVDEEYDDPNDAIEDSGSYGDRNASSIRSCDPHINNMTRGSQVEDVCSTVDETASSPSHNPTHGCTAKAGHSMNETPPAKDGQNSSQEISEALEKQIHTYYVSVERLPEIQVARLSLPILAEEQVVMEAINDHDIVVLCGETGSGKTTQVPQFLYEAGYHKKMERGVIGVTEPRRVAAVAMSQRVAKELNLTTGEVSYHIRYENNVTEKTCIKFMTDGVLLKEMEQDFLLSKYSVIIIDEAHERSVFTDILIGMLSRVVPLRNKKGSLLKLIIMSATLRVEDFTQNKHLFTTPPPVIKVESRQFPVTVHFNRRTPENYVLEAYRKVCKIHRTLGAGNVLVFVTGQKEVHTLCKKLQQTFPSSQPWAYHAATNTSRGTTGHRCTGEVDLDSYPIVPLDAPATTAEQSLLWEEEEDGIPLATDSSDDGSEFSDDDELLNRMDAELPMMVKPLYSQLPSDQQAKVFAPPPDGVRMCVVATNVAETSLTIPGVKFVVDTGMVKVRYYDKITGISTFRVGWTSKASANQRAGRAGRTEAGHCYRLYSSAVFQHQCDDFSPPELTRRPVDDLFLQMKVLNIDKVINFPFPTPPSKESLQSAEKLLVQLGALEHTDASKMTSLTPLGRTMSQFPVAPRYARMLCVGSNHKECLPYIIAIVAGLSVKEVFINSEFNWNQKHSMDGKPHDANLSAIKRNWAGQGESLLLGDLLVLLKAIGACEFAGCTSEFCKTHGLRLKAMKEIRKLRSQLTNNVNVVFPNIEGYMDPKMPPPSQQQVKLLRQIILSGMGDHVARKIHTGDMNAQDRKKYKNAYQCMLCESLVYLHPSSVLSTRSPPEFVVFQEITETTQLFMRDVVAVESNWLPLFVPNMCTFSKPLDEPLPCYDDTTGAIKCHMAATYGCYSWRIPPQELPYPDGIEKFKWFGQFFLQGEVCPALEELTTSLLLPPVTMTKKWAKLHKCTEVLLAALVNRDVCSKSSLMEVWKEDKKFLLGAYSTWLPQSRHQQLLNIWPPI